MSIFAIDRCLAPMNGFGVHYMAQHDAPNITVFVFKAVNGARREVIERFLVPLSLANKLSIYESPREVIKLCRANKLNE